VKEKASVHRRRILREKVLQALYAREISNDPSEHIIHHVLAAAIHDETELEFTSLLFASCVEHRDELDQLVQQKAEHWDLSRIALIDKLLLRLGACEFLYFEEIPPKVTINEAIEIAKRYSTEKSGQFVNGILDSLLNELIHQGRVKKKGRGLLDTSKSKTSKLTQSSS
jgi:N utilization substance protein B